MTLNDKCSKHLDSLFMMFILHVNNIEIIVLGDKYAQYIKLVVYVARYFILNLFAIIQEQVLIMQCDPIFKILIALNCR